MLLDNLIVQNKINFIISSFMAWYIELWHFHPLCRDFHDLTSNWVPDSYIFFLTGETHFLISFYFTQTWLHVPLSSFCQQLENLGTSMEFFVTQYPNIDCFITVSWIKVSSSSLDLIFTMPLCTDCIPLVLLSLLTSILEQQMRELC